MPSSPLRLAPVTLGCLLLLSGACTGNTTPPGPVVGSPDAGPPGDDGGGVPGADAGAAPGTDAGPAPGTDAGPVEPARTSACDGNGSCDPGETCASCGSDCGSCDVESLSMQRPKYVDEACGHMGDGLSDECAASDGGAGRYNELQAALDGLEAGDTLHLHPGDYYRDVTGRDSGGIYTMGNAGTAARPIVITARFREDRPTIHSCDPLEPTRCPMPALAVYGDHAIVDHLQIRGRLQVWGATASVMQYVECTHGWGSCGDGNWSCLRIESCTDCVAHHNYVHDVSGAGVGEACLDGETVEFPDRGAGLKEFQSEGTIWEFNTVTGAPVWAYDLHRNSENTTLRFNDFPAFPGDGMRIHRTRNTHVYGNVFVARDGEAGTCVKIWGRNERVDTEPHVVEVHHNTCVGANTGIDISEDLPARVHDNVIQGLRAAAEAPRNVVIGSDESAADHNAYDGSGNYRRQTYEPSTWSADLAAWQLDTGWDGESVEAAGGACSFATAPTGDGTPYDLSIVDDTCGALARDGGAVGAFGITSCVGHRCP